jgi:protein O-mannosyl-transferase
MDRAELKPIWGGALLVLLIVAAYWPSLGGGFLFDDSVMVVDNPLFKGSDVPYRIWLTTESADRWPVSYTAFWVQWRLWGKHAVGYRVVNLALHCADAVLVWLILRRLKVPGAWVGGLLFGIHPINVGTAAWISEQKNTLSMLFYCVSLLLYLKFDESSRRGWYWISLGAFGLGLLSKTSVVMLPVVLLGIDWWKRGRIGKKDWLRSGPFFGLSMLAAVGTILSQESGPLSGTGVHSKGFLYELATAGMAPWFYLYKTVWPVNLMMIYPYWKVNTASWLAYVPGVILLACFGVLIWKRKSWGRPVLFAMGYFLVTLFPVLGFFEQTFHAFSRVADHWMYCAIVGPLALAAAGGAVLWRRANGPGRAAAMVFSVAIIALLEIATWRRSQIYRNDQSLWLDNIAKNPDAWVAYNNLGVGAGEKGEMAQSVAYYQRALEINPDYATAHHNLGRDYYVEGKLQMAIDEDLWALRIKDNEGGVHKDLALIYWQKGDAKDAITHWDRALDQDPDSAEILNDLAWALATTDSSDGGNSIRAVLLAQQACSLDEAHNATYLDTLAVAYAAVGDFPDAVGTERHALQVAKVGGDAKMIGDIEKRLALFRDGKMYRASGAGG